jgi:hypothetical protein
MGGGCELTDTTARALALLTAGEFRTQNQVKTGNPVIFQVWTI